MPRQSVSVFHVNVRCLSGKTSQLSLFLTDSKYDVLCLSEHWQDETQLNMINLPHFTVASSFCRDFGRHGGVAIYLRNFINYRPLCLSDFCSAFDAEFCGVYLTETKVALVTLYRSCSGVFGVFLDRLENLLRCIFDRYRSIILVGDFNINFNQDSVGLSDLLSIFYSFGMNVTINQCTRVTASSATCIDNVITNLPESSYSVGVSDPCISDHSGQFINFRCAVQKSKPVTRRFFNHRNIQRFRSFLLGVDWGGCGSRDVRVSSEVLLAILVGNFDLFFPLKTVRPANNGLCIGWYNDSLRKKREILSSVKTVFDVTRDPRDLAAYRGLHKDYIASIRHTKRCASDDFMLRAENKARAGWALINSERNTGVRRSVTGLCPQSIAEHFIEVAEAIVRDLPAINHDGLDSALEHVPRAPCSFFLFPVSPGEVRLTIMSLKDSASLDIYDLGSRLLKEISDIIAEPIATLFNNCISEGVFPDAFKLAKVLPLHKGGDNAVLDNYRPISIVPIIGKTFEKILKVRLTNYFENNGLLSDGQYGFRTGRSTIQALRCVVDSVVEGIESGCSAAVTLCDLSRAFDCVSHRLLLRKLSLYGIRGPPLSLLRSYLMDRKQCVVVDGLRSDFLSVKQGVPQGSILGPLLFIIYINDLCNFVAPSKCVLFADDASLINIGRSVQLLTARADRLQSGVERWLALGCLKLNGLKTHRLIFSSNRSVTCGASARLLGVILDDGLTWSPHVKYLTKKLASLTFLFRNLREFLSLQVLKMAYFSLFHSHLSYGVALWGNSADAVKIFRQQKKVIRVIMRAQWRAHCRPFFRQLGVMPLPCVYVYFMLLEIHRVRSSLPVNSDYHSYGTRNVASIRPIRFRLEMSSRNSLNLGLYNHLPLSLRNLSLPKFKSSLKKILIEQSFYSVSEFLEYGFPD